MRFQTGNLIRKTRIFVQIFALLIFLLFFFLPAIIPNKTWLSSTLFFYIDPLLLLTSSIVGKTIAVGFLFTLIALLLTLFFGRFYCGWICPLGTINHFFSWIIHKIYKVKYALNKKILKIKYYVLIFIIGSSIMGMNVVGWFDPNSLLTRSLAVVSLKTNVFICNDNIEKISPEHNQGLSLENEIFAVKENQNQYPRSSNQAFPIGSILFLIICLNYFYPRFYCNAICPLGAVYGLVSKIGFFHFKVDTACNNCNSCTKSCTYLGNPGQNYMKSECMSCFNCTVDCKTNSVKVNFEIPKKSNSTQLDLGKRKAFTVLATGLIFASLNKIQSGGNSKRRHNFMRPPGAIQEVEFLNKCTSCGQCTQVCPTNFIQPATLQAGLEGFWTPIVDPKNGYCAWDCNICTRICPSDAIKKLSLKKKQEYKIGIAIVDKNRCYTYADGFNCTVCYEKCPIPEKAIKLKETEVWNFRGRLVNVNQIYVQPDLCNGCGICEFQCPRHDSPGIFISSENEYRELDGELL